MLQSRDCLTHDVRLFYARYAIVLCTMYECLCAEGAAAREGCDCLKQEGCDCLGSEGAGAQVSDY